MSASGPAPCACGRTAPRVRCIGRTDDMLIVRGVNVFPTALREIVNEFAPAVSGVISVRPRTKGFRQDPPLTVVVELAEGGDRQRDLAERIRAAHPRDPAGHHRVDAGAATAACRAPSYKSQLVDWSEAQASKE